MAAEPEPEPGPRRGLLVDYGGVLTSNVFASFEAFCRSEGLHPGAVRDRFRHDRQARELLEGLETGTLAEPRFERRFAALLGVRSPALIDRLLAGLGPDEAMLGALRRARAAGVRTGLISNSWGSARPGRAEALELVDAAVISSEVGVRKPDPEIYRLGAQGLGLHPADCVFVDDLAFNLAPARDLGMATVHHVGAAETLPELERLLGVGLR